MLAPDGVLFLALDSCAPDLVGALAADGRLPHLAKLLETSRRVPVQNPAGLYVGALWPTFLAAEPPGHHGHFCWEQLEPRSYTTRRGERGGPARPPFWTELARAGRRVAMVDVPEAGITELPGGIQVNEWGVHRCASGLATWPDELLDDLLDRHGRHPLPDRCDGRRHTVTEFRLLRDQLVDGASKKAELLLDVLDRGEWDLFGAVFCESHCAGHQTWHLHDPGHARHDPVVVDGVGDVLLLTYEALDAAVGRVLGAVGHDATVVLLLSHGIGPHYDGNLVLEQVLRRLERLSRAGRAAEAVIDFCWDAVPWHLRRRLTARFDPTWRGGSRMLFPRHPARRRWFQVTNNEAHGGVRINLAGREPRGVVPAHRYEEVCDELATELRLLRDARTGEPVAERVVVVHEHFDGERLDALPDVVVEWRFDRPVRAVCSPRAGRVTAHYEGLRTGEHRPGGLLLATGPGLAPSVEPAAPIEAIPHTLAAMIGATLPERAGSPIPGLVPTTRNGAAHR